MCSDDDDDDDDVRCDNSDRVVFVIVSVVCVCEGVSVTELGSSQRAAVHWSPLQGSASQSCHWFVSCSYTYVFN